MKFNAFNPNRPDRLFIEKISGRKIPTFPARDMCLEMKSALLAHVEKHGAAELVIRFAPSRTCWPRADDYEQLLSIAEERVRNDLRGWKPLKGGLWIFLSMTVSRAKSVVMESRSRRADADALSLDNPDFAEIFAGGEHTPPGGSATEPETVASHAVATASAAICIAANRIINERSGAKIASHSPAQTRKALAGLAARINTPKALAEAAAFDGRGDAERSCPECFAFARRVGHDRAISVQHAARFATTPRGVAVFHGKSHEGLRNLEKFIGLTLPPPRGSRESRTRMLYAANGVVRYLAKNCGNTPEGDAARAACASIGTFDPDIETFRAWFARAAQPPGGAEIELAIAA